MEWRGRGAFGLVKSIKRAIMWIVLKREKGKILLAGTFLLEFSIEEHKISYITFFIKP